MDIKLKSMPFIFLLFLAMSIHDSASATVYFYYDAENGSVGSNLTNPPFCQGPCSGSGEIGHVGDSGGTPKGLKYFYWNIAANQKEAYTEVALNTPTGTNILGKTFYMAYYFNYTRINGLDIWHEGNGVQSADKGLEIRGPGSSGSGIRWVTGMGQWDSLRPNQDHKFTMWLGNPSGHLNRSLEVNDIYVPNQNGYTASNTLQLDYDKWHSVVLGLKMATNNSGSVSLWINGILVYQYNNIITTQSANIPIDKMEIHGTIAQPAYDAPAHIRKVDAWILTDNWQDIVDGGYLGSNSAPLAPQNLKAQ